jgi:hypothetical protein
MENISFTDEEREVLLDNEVREKYYDYKNDEKDRDSKVSLMNQVSLLQTHNSFARTSATHSQKPTQRKFTLICNLKIL